MEFLTFELNDVEYGINIEKVREVFDIVPMTPIPNMPEYMAGVTNIRGNVIPIIDLKLKLGFPIGSGMDSGGIIFLELEKEHSEFVVGVIVDTVQNVIVLNKEDIIGTPEMVQNKRNDIIPGLGRTGSKFITLLDMDKIIVDNCILRDH